MQAIIKRRRYYAIYVETHLMKTSELLRIPSTNTNKLSTDIEEC